MIAIIGGSGLTQLDNLEITHRKIVRTLGPTYAFVRWIGDYPDPARSAP